MLYFPYNPALLTVVEYRDPDVLGVGEVECSKYFSFFLLNSLASYMILQEL